MRALKPLLTVFVVLFVGYVCFLNTKLYYRPAYTARGTNHDLVKQWQFLKHKMHSGEDDKMQQLFPEGYMFMNALYGLFSAELALANDSAISSEAYLESYRCYQNMERQQAKDVFPEKLLLPYGAYYNGWSAYHMAKMIETGKANNDTLLRDAFKQRCAAIALAMGQRQNPYLESYQQFAWPADMLMCVAALSAHDRLYAPQYKTTIANWLTAVKQRTDKLGLLPHEVDYLTGFPVQGARGSSMSLMLCFLKEVDTAFYYQQLALYKKHFVTSRLGLPGILEYPAGTEGDGDSDSGPVIWGVGGSASIVGLRALGAAKENETAIGLRNSIEAFGVATQGKEQKRYLFGALPMADAFIAWANSTEAAKANQLNTGAPWRREFQLYSAIAVLVCLLLLWLVWRRRGQRNL